MKRDPVHTAITQVVHLDREDLTDLRVVSHFTTVAGGVKPHVLTGGYLRYRWDDRVNHWVFDGGVLYVRLVKRDGELYVNQHDHMLWPYRIESEFPGLIDRYLPMSTVIVGVTE